MYTAALADTYITIRPWVWGNGDGEEGDPVSDEEPAPSSPAGRSTPDDESPSNRTAPEVTPVVPVELPTAHECISVDARLEILRKETPAPEHGMLEWMPERHMPERTSE